MNDLNKSALVSAYKSLLPVAVNYGYDNRGENPDDLSAYNVGELAAGVSVLAEYISAADDREWLMKNPSGYGAEYDAECLAVLDATLEPYKRN